MINKTNNQEGNFGRFLWRPALFKRWKKFHKDTDIQLSPTLNELIEGYLRDKGY